ncbi:acyl-CoA dehydratase activase [Natranaerofaba carboxydovora]|uniref:acyl-CoA dehydratase activase n=1 Tax=Natranaerofaba carboxydovora TaxID=2742683 RepID=UPI001F1438E7|nr:acyl-CoA dehydratase activase [Natranaerofaba carboxydovora]UMZ73128.1 2-hydroxyisocaproyl-CoA dehydratase activator [Natranaerofaba carboxydovora]
MIVAGIDIGSLSTEAVILKDSEIVDYNITTTGANSKNTAKKVYDDILDKTSTSPSEVKYIVATGYGRISAPFANKQVTEITCHALGINYLNPRIKTVIDIGGQDSKAIKLDEQGNVEDFVMNDKCAAGTGRFLEVMAEALEVSIDDFSHTAERVKKSIPISNMCAVFAESEVVSLIAEGNDKGEIIRGLAEAIGDRTEGFAHRINLEKPIAMTGGVAKNKGIVKVLEERFNSSIFIPEEPQLVGALGAAIKANKLAKKTLNQEW